MTGTEQQPIYQGEIVNIGTLDLTSLRQPDELAGITRIVNVGAVLVAEPVYPALLRVSMKQVGAVVPVPVGEHVKVLAGQMSMRGETLTNSGGDPNATLIVAGQVLVTSPVERVGYKELIVSGQLIAPVASEAALGAGITRLLGQVIYYTGTPRLFVGEHAFFRAFFEWLDEPVTLILTGKFRFEEDTPADLLRQKVTSIILAGTIRAPRSILPMIQVLATENAGQILPLDAPEDHPSR